MRYAIYRIATLTMPRPILNIMWYAIAITSHRNLLCARGRFFNAGLYFSLICDMRGPMAACHLAPPHSLKGFSMSSNPTMSSSQPWNLTCSNFCIGAQFWVMFTLLDSEWRALWSEVKIIKIMKLLSFGKFWARDHSFPLQNFWNPKV